MGQGSALPVGPGFLGFVTIFLLAVVVWFLLRNMSGRLRRMAYREREAQEQEMSRRGGMAAGAAGGSAGGGAAGGGAAGRGAADGAAGPGDAGGSHVADGEVPGNREGDDA